MELSIMLKMSVNMGDHAETRLIPFAHIPGESLESLYERLAEAKGGWRSMGAPAQLPDDAVIQIRRVLRTEE